MVMTTTRTAMMMMTLMMMMYPAGAHVAVHPLRGGPVAVGAGLRAAYD
jgi:hypothetical protein